MGFEPDYQVIVEWEAVGEIVDAMGGVWFDVPRNMNYHDPLQNLHIHQEKGYRLLTGEDAMEVLRFRRQPNGPGIPGRRCGPHQDAAGIFDGHGRATAEDRNIAKSTHSAEVFRDNVETNLTFQNIFWFARPLLGGLKPENVEFVTMPNTPAYAYSSIHQQGNGRYSEPSYVTP